MYYLQGTIQTRFPMYCFDYKLLTGFDKKTGVPLSQGARQLVTTWWWFREGADGKKAHQIAEFPVLADEHPEPILSAIKESNEPSYVKRSYLEKNPIIRYRHFSPWRGDGRLVYTFSINTLHNFQIRTKYKDTVVEQTRHIIERFPFSTHAQLYGVITHEDLKRGHEGGSTYTLSKELASDLTSYYNHITGPDKKEWLKDTARILGSTLFNNDINLPEGAKEPTPEEYIEFFRQMRETHNLTLTKEDIEASFTNPPQPFDPGLLDKLYYNAQEKTGQSVPVAEISAPGYAYEKDDHNFYNPYFPYSLTLEHHPHAGKFPVTRHFGVFQAIMDMMTRESLTAHYQVSVIYQLWLAFRAWSVPFTWQKEPIYKQVQPMKEFLRDNILPFVNERLEEGDTEVLRGDLIRRITDPMAPPSEALEQCQSIYTNLKYRKWPLRQWYKARFNDMKAARKLFDKHMRARKHEKPNVMTQAQDAWWGITLYLWGILWLHKLAREGLMDMLFLPFEADTIPLYHYATSYDEHPRTPRVVPNTFNLVFSNFYSRIYPQSPYAHIGGGAIASESHALHPYRSPLCTGARIAWKDYPATAYYLQARGYFLTKMLKKQPDAQYATTNPYMIGTVKALELKGVKRKDIAKYILGKEAAHTTKTLRKFLPEKEFKHTPEDMQKLHTSAQRALHVFKRHLVDNIKEPVTYKWHTIPYIRGNEPNVQVFDEDPFGGAMRMLIHTNSHGIRLKSTLQSFPETSAPQWVVNGHKMELDKFPVVFYIHSIGGPINRKKPAQQFKHEVRPVDWASVCKIWKHVLNVKEKEEPENDPN